jgi:GAF domain-containing protein
VAGSIDPQALGTSLDALRGLVRDGGELRTAVTDVTDAVAGLFRLGGAGLMLVDDGQVLRYVAASDAASAALESAQEELGHGPCVDALVHDRLVTTTDLVTDERWPGLAERVSPAGARAVLGVPVTLAGGPVGSLNVYHGEPHDWDETECAALEAFGAVVESLMRSALQAHEQSAVAAQLQHALDSRVQIERAVGVLMGRERIDAVDAFDRLRRTARNRRVKVVAVAAELLEEAAADARGA